MHEVCIFTLHSLVTISVALSQRTIKELEAGCGRHFALVYFISNNSGFHLKHPGVPDGSDGSGGTSYPLTENQTRRVVLHTSLPAAIIPCLLFLRRIALYITPAAPASGFLYFASGMW